MRKLRHPIAVFVVTVLVVIGIGVGVVVATTNQKVYGPSWGRFTVAFSSRVQEQPLTQTVFNYDSSVIYEGRNPFLHGRIAIDDHVTTYQVSEDVSGDYLREAALGYQGALPVPLPSEPRQDTEHVNGFRFLRLGPSCARTFCEGVWIVVQNRTTWVLTATSFLGLGPVSAFLNSFQPIG